MMTPNETIMDTKSKLMTIGSGEEYKDDEDPEDFVDEEMKTSAKLEMNPLFKDVEDTGKWGEIGPKEVCRVVAIGSLVVISVAVALWLALGSGEAVPPPGADLKLDSVLQAFNASNYTSNSDLPREVDFYKGLATQNSAPAQYRAISWLLFDDGYYSEQEFALRVALASLYYCLGGESWKNSTNWLSSKKACDWKGVECDLRTGKFLELNLDGNNLNGTIPNEVALLQDVSTIWLSNNKLEGTIPGGAFAELPKLTVLFLENNQLTGTVPEKLGESVGLGK
jgi:hypothetical protein